jgi:molybdopterin synthase catalytic subunit
MNMHRRVVVQHADFDIGVEWAALRSTLSGRAGAMAAFCGVVRDQFETDSVSNLELEHYPGMTEKSIDSVLDRAETRWPLDAIVVIHRIGSLAPGDQIVLVIATSRHRQAALEACTFVIDLLKTEAVFWKREVLSSGARWIESSSVDHSRSSDWRKT